MSEWIVPCKPQNMQDYVLPGFLEQGCFYWELTNKFQIDDVIYLYVSSPIREIQWKCVVTDIFSDGNGDYAEFTPTCKYADSHRLSFQQLKNNGLKNRLMGCCHAPQSVSNYINSYSFMEFDDTEKGYDRRSWAKARVNQDAFRSKILEKYHNRCCLCGAGSSSERLLIASHIKPWKVSDDQEKVSVHNGLLLCPNHDKLFDIGMISFKDNGEIIISNKLCDSDIEQFQINHKMSINVDPEMRLFLQYHREKIFREDV